MLIIKVTLLFFLSSNLFASEVDNNLLKNFETDFCTMFKEGTKKSPDLWKHCCVKHDLAYWVAGNKSDMKRADKEILNCVKKTGKPFVAKLMYSGIKFGHLSPIKNKYKWGWAHKDNRKKYQELSAVEIENIQLRVLEIDDVDTQTLLDFLNFRFPSK